MSSLSKVARFANLATIRNKILSPSRSSYSNLTRINAILRIKHNNFVSQNTR